jgi:cytochrome b
MHVLDRAEEERVVDQPPDAVKIWDPLVRLFHWSLVSAFVLAWITADEWDRAHEWSGYAILGLLAVRLVWGVVGTRYARFSNFVHRPTTILGYLKDTVFLRAKRYLGHNPAGGAMIIALIVALAVTGGTGYLTSIEFGPGEWMEELHEVAANATLLLVGLHIAGVIASSLEHRENLVWSMFTGKKRALEDE